MLLFLLHRRSADRHSPLTAINVRAECFACFAAATRTVEFRTINPLTQTATNCWWVGADGIEVLTHGSIIYLTLPGTLLRARTYLCLSMPSEEAALALVSAWGWEEQT